MTAYLLWTKWHTPRQIYALAFGISLTVFLVLNRTLPFIELETAAKLGANNKEELQKRVEFYNSKGFDSKKDIYEKKDL